MNAQTIIGSGMAGMSCTMRLRAYHRPLTLITDRLDMHDHKGLRLEPGSIAGIRAANQIIKNT